MEEPFRNNLEAEFLVGDLTEQLRQGRNAVTRMHEGSTQNTCISSCCISSSSSSGRPNPRSIMKTDTEAGRNSEKLRKSSCCSTSSASSSQRVRFFIPEEYCPAPEYSSSWSLHRIRLRPVLRIRPLSSPSSRSAPLPSKRRAPVKDQNREEGKECKDKGFRAWHFAAFVLGFLHPALIVLCFLIAASAWSPLSDFQWQAVEARPSLESI
eukprot:2537539-Rhodomonas_salina.1